MSSSDEPPQSPSTSGSDSGGDADDQRTRMSGITPPDFSKSASEPSSPSGSGDWSSAPPPPSSSGGWPPPPPPSPSGPYGDPYAGQYGQPGGSYGQPGGQPGGYGEPPPSYGGSYGPGGPGVPPPPGAPGGFGGPDWSPPSTQQVQREAKGFFGALLDFSFNHFVTPIIIKVVYVIATVALLLGWLFFLVAAFSQSVGAGLFVLILGPVFVVLYLALIRMTLEFYMAVVRMSEDIHQRLK